MTRATGVLAMAMLVTACGGNPASPEPTPTPTPTPTPAPLFMQSGTGNTVIDLPTIVSRLRIQGAYGGNSSNFIIWCGNQLVVNELLGTAWGRTSYDGTHQIATRGCALRIENSTAVLWTLTEVR